MGWGGYGGYGYGGYNGWWGNRGYGGYGGYGAYGGYPYGGYGGYGHGYNNVQHNPYRHYAGQGRYDLGRMNYYTKGAFSGTQNYQNLAKTQEEGYVAHIAQVAK